MANLRYGSTGDDVKKLQETLNTNGYSLDVDGIYGSNTQEAVKDYQSKNGLSVDGIAGEQTLGKLYSTGTDAAADTTPQTEEGLPETEAVEPKIQDEAWTGGAYGPAMEAALEEMLNGKEFSYSLNGDALYRQYADEAVQNGKMAMMDTMGQAAALTGGYGNSYASSAGNQAYQKALSGLGDTAAELYALAYERYQAEKKQKAEEYEALAGLYDREYGEYQDRQTAAAEKREKEAEAQQQQWENEQKEAELAEDKRQHNENLAERQRQYNLKNGIGTSNETADTGSTGTESVTYDTHGYTVAQIVSLQQNAGIRADGIWGAQTEKAYKAGFRPTKKITGHVTSYEPVR